MKRTFGRRPARLGRIFATSPVYFVTFCTHERQRFLAKDEVHTAFALFAKRAECNFRLGAWIGALKQVLAKAGILSRAKGQVWQEGFFDHLLRTNESYSQKWNYVRENPVRAGLVKSAADWPYQGEIVYIDRT